MLAQAFTSNFLSFYLSSRSFQIRKVLDLQGIRKKKQEIQPTIEFFSLFLSGIFLVKLHVPPKR